MDIKKRFGLVVVGTCLVAAWSACTSDDETTGPGGTPTANATGGNGTGAGPVGGSGDGGFGFDAGGPTDGPSGCSPKNFSLQQAPPAEVYLIIDRSGSMNEPGATPGLSKWDEVYAAADLALTQYEGTIHFGLMAYPTGPECATEGPQVGIAENNRGAIMYVLEATNPSGGTPTAAALNNAASSLSDLGSPDSPKFLVLATDGGPNCNYMLNADPACTCTEVSSEYCCTNYPEPCYFGHFCLDDDRTLQIIGDLHTNDSIDTFVIGLAGTDSYVDLLDAMAVAGGRPQQGGSTEYYAANDQAELLAALQTIAVSVISCEIDLEVPPEYPDEVSIYIDGVEVPRDPTHTNGWDYTDATYTKIELFGEACEKLQDGEQHQVTATFDCTVR